jgi:hypothetical protein
VRMSVCLYNPPPPTPETTLSLLGNGTIKSLATSIRLGSCVFSAARVVLKESSRLVLPSTSCKLIFQQINIVYGLLFKGEGNLYNGDISKIVLRMESNDDGSRVKANALITYSLVNKYCWQEVLIK